MHSLSAHLWCNILVHFPGYNASNLVFIACQMLSQSLYNAKMSTPMCIVGKSQVIEKLKILIAAFVLQWLN